VSNRVSTARTITNPPRIALWDDSEANVMMTPRVPEEGKIPVWR
jgi:hypothetical protein